MPKYDYRCPACGTMFELVRRFGEAGEPTCCPVDGGPAARIFSPPLDLLVYNREPVARPTRVTLPPGALSCHDHGAPPAAPGGEGERDHGHPPGHGHSHGHSHPHPH